MSSVLPQFTQPEHPAYLARIASNEVDAADFAGHPAVAPLPFRLAVALLCVRHAGFSAGIIRRNALVERTSEDPVFGNALQDNPNGPDPIMVKSAVYAIRVQHDGQVWIMDGWGNLGDEAILAAALRDTHRLSGHYTHQWLPSADRARVLVEMEKNATVIGRLVAAWRADGLQRYTPAIAHCAQPRRI